MFDFARSATQNLPEGHPLWILTVKAHYEVFLGLMSLAQQSRHPVAMEAAAKYWKRPSVKQEVLHSYQQYVGSSNCRPTATVAERSVLMSARNWYAYSFAHIGHAEMARRELVLIGKTPTESPWNSLDRYQKACNEAGVSL